MNGTDATSVLEIMALGVKQGETVELRATGPQAAESIVALKEMIENASLCGVAVVDIHPSTTTAMSRER